MNYLDQHAGIGFQHMLEDGLAIVENRTTVDEPRARFVLDELARLFEEAAQGSQIYNSDVYFFDPGNSHAAQSFAFIEQYVGNGDTEKLSEELSIVAEVMRSLHERQEVAPDQAERATAVLREIVNHVTLSGGHSLPSEPTTLERRE